MHNCDTNAPRMPLWSPPLMPVLSNNISQQNMALPDSFFSFFFLALLLLRSHQLFRPAVMVLAEP